LVTRKVTLQYKSWLLIWYMGDAKLISFIARSKRRLEVLKLLFEKERSQTELMRLTQMYKGHTARTIKELSEKKLIICSNPEDRVFRFYKINKLGKNILKDIDKIIL